jgi:flagellar biosynthesis/type III secretory pathway protein FliH
MTETTKLKDFLNSLPLDSDTPAPNDACDDAYDEGYDAGYASGRNQGLLDMYALMRNLDEEQVQTLKRFAKQIYISALEKQ